MDFNKVQEALRRAVLSDKDLRQTIKGVYTGYLADVQQPQFPCINYTFVDTTPEERYATAASSILRVWIWSGKSYAECHDILRSLLEVWHNKILLFSGVYVHPTFTRLLDSGMDKPEKAYYIVTAWTLRWKEV